MANWGKFDYSEFKQFGKDLEDMQKAFPGFMAECVRELANRLLAKVVPRTPVGEYGNHWVEFTTGKGEHVRFWAKDSRQGGTLRKSWVVGQVKLTSKGAEIEVYNPVKYAPYVEHGHRTANHKGWVEGRFMMTISVAELERELPVIMERKMKKFIEKYLGG